MNSMNPNFSQKSCVLESVIAHVDVQAVTWIWHCVNSRTAWSTIPADSSSMTKHVQIRQIWSRQAHYRIFMTLNYSIVSLFCGVSQTQTRCKRTVWLQWGNMLMPYPVIIQNIFTHLFVCCNFCIFSWIHFVNRLFWKERGRNSAFLV